MLRKTILVVLVLLLLGAAGIWIAGSVMMGRLGRAWEKVSPAAGIEAVAFRASDGVELKGWWWRGSDPSRAVLLLHGLVANRLQMLPRAKWLHQLGYSVLLFDFRGCGESGGHATLGYDERLDVAAALQFLREKESGAAIVLLGQSMGAAAAVMAVDQWEGVKGAVLEHLYDRIESAIRARVRRRVGWLEPALSPLLLWQVPARLGFPPAALAPVERISKARCPVLLGYGGIDPTVSVEGVRALFMAGPHPTTLWSLQQAGHEDLYRFNPASYKAKIGEFLSETLGPPAAERKE
jgi:alpha-beta hydrolase superfamily lysophospholipase